jgi:3-oxoacyl-[acyl-carrier protein] reductase
MYLYVSNNSNKNYIYNSLSRFKDVIYEDNLAEHYSTIKNIKTLVMDYTDNFNAHYTHFLHNTNTNVLANISKGIDFLRHVCNSVHHELNVVFVCMFHGHFNSSIPGTFNANVISHTLKGIVASLQEDLSNIGHRVTLLQIPLVKDCLKVTNLFTYIPEDFIEYDKVVDYIEQISGMDRIANIKEMVIQAMTNPMIKSRGSAFDLKKSHSKVAIVTGASKGIGRGIAIYLASLGYSLCLISRDVAKLEELMDEIWKSYNIECDVEGCDLSDIDKVEDLCKRLKNRYESISLLVCNAGINRKHSIINSKDKFNMEVLNTNFMSHYKIIYSLNDRITSNIIFIGSVAASTVYNSYAGLSMYTSSKMALQGLANGIFEDYSANGVKISTIICGLSNTELGTRPSNNKNVQLSLGDQLVQIYHINHIVGMILNSRESECITHVTVIPSKEANLLKRSDEYNVRNKLI